MEHIESAGQSRSAVCSLPSPPFFHTCTFPTYDHSLLTQENADIVRTPPCVERLSGVTRWILARLSPSFRWSYISVISLRVGFQARLRFRSWAFGYLAMLLRPLSRRERVCLYTKELTACDLARTLLFFDRLRAGDSIPSAWFGYCFEFFREPYGLKSGPSSGLVSATSTQPISRRDGCRR